MTEADKELLAYLAQPPQLPTAYAVVAWLEGDKPNERAPAEARQLLSSAANLATALRIRDAIDVIEAQTFETFWVTVETMLKQLLHRSGFKGWRVLLSLPDRKHRGFISLIPVSEAVGENQMFHVCAENLAVPKNKEAAFFGIWRGELSEHDPELSSQLKREGFKPHQNWSGWKWFQACGMPDFTISRENVIRLNADHHSTDKPLANEVAQALWQLFDQYRLRLEELNRTINEVEF